METMTVMVVPDDQIDPATGEPWATTTGGSTLRRHRPRARLTAANLAAHVGVDQKTIHNWCNQKDMPHRRTPGRQLWFVAADVNPWLVRHGYDPIVPPAGAS